jgi:hypothetical protein
MRHAQLGDIFDRDDPVGGCGTREQRGEQRGLARSGRSRDEQILAPRNQAHDRLERHEREEARRLEIGKPRPVDARQPYREERPNGGDRREHRVNPDAVVEAHINARCRFVDVSPAERDEAHGEFAQLRLAQGGSPLPGQAPTSVDPQLVRAVDEDIGDRRIRDEWPEIAELRQLLARDSQTDGGGRRGATTSRRERRTGPARDEAFPGHGLVHPKHCAVVVGIVRARADVRIAGGHERIEPVGHRTTVSPGVAVTSRAEPSRGGARMTGGAGGEEPRCGDRPVHVSRPGTRRPKRRGAAPVGGNRRRHSNAGLGGITTRCLPNLHSTDFSVLQHDPL